jgi:hypothetical protein
MARTPGTGTTNLPPTVITTTVQDPRFPNEPWVITSTQWPDETIEAFIARHRHTVNLVREITSGKTK